MAPGPTPSPTPPFGNRPAAAGDTFAYAGSRTQTFVRPPLPAGDITPSPNPTDSATIVTTVAQTVTVSQPASFNGVASPFDFRAVETDTVPNGLETTTATTDDYYQYLAQGASTAIRFLGSIASDGAGNSFSTQIGTGNGLVDIVPETTGPITPVDNAAETTTETDSSTASLTRTTNADGTYSETGAQLSGDPTGTAISATQNADGSGSYTFPALVPEDVTYTVSAPQPNPSGGPNQIAVTLSVPADLVEAAPAPGATPVVTTTSIAVWYPQPLVLSQQTVIDTGSAALPPGCAVPAALVRPARQIIASKTTVDPLFGEIEVASSTTYTEDNVGIACLVLNDQVTQYYDLSGQNQIALLSFASTPQQTTTTTETLGLRQSTVLASDHVRAAAALGARAATAHFQALEIKRRAARHAAFSRVLVRRARQGAVR